MESTWPEDSWKDSNSRKGDEESWIPDFENQ